MSCLDMDRGWCRVGGHPDVDKISFTGEASTAKIIQRSALETMKRVTFELGGRTWCSRMADMEAAVEGRTSVCISIKGQCCYCGNRLFVEDGIHDGLSIAFNKRTVPSWRPLRSDTEQGPQVDRSVRQDLTLCRTSRR